MGPSSPPSPSLAKHLSPSTAEAQQHPHGYVDDVDRLAQLGYEQELTRGWSALESFGISFSIISICTGITTSFSLGLTNGGPGVMSIGWICVSFMTMCAEFVALSMAEVVSAIPSAAGPFAAYCTGWFNFLGQAGVTTAIVFGNATFIATVAALRGFVITAPRVIGIHAALLIFAGLVNTVGIRFLGHLNRFSILVHSVGVFSICVALLAKAPTHQTAKEVFATYYDESGWGERASPAFVALTGILLAQFTITGFDASAHMAEETKDAGRAAPIGVIMSVGVSTVFGFFYLVSLLFSMQGYASTVAPATGQPVLQIFVDVFGQNGGTAAAAIIIICISLCGTFSVTSNSRMFYAFSRDRALFGWFDHVDKRTQVPVRTVWLAVLLAFCLALPSLGNTTAYVAVTSIATIGLYISYVLPIAIGLAFDQNRFCAIRGPFHLGAFSRPCAIIATGYVIFITVVFCLPTISPVNSQTLNYAPVAVGIVCLWVIISWFGWARHWFHGPRQADLTAVDPAEALNSVTNAALKLEPALIEDKGVVGGGKSDADLAGGAKVEQVLTK
ncbi:amino acid transmembrane transporter [Rhodotorula toruloides]|uniref:Amino acid transmembrane transporter n=1 Tax=Rhodotorula toruloides TaxID=5286 RepID=A0A511KBP2_RHOTO|nr:amino acid transmembrane transporter [Rhodotorula toruloides]